LAERRLGIDLVVAEPAQDHQFLGFPSLGEQRLRLFGGTSRSSSVVMNRIERGAILSTTHSG
jgi:hypothetical protein